MVKCVECGTNLKNCGGPIWEDYCPNEECNYEAEAFKSSIRKGIEAIMKRKALESAAPEMYEGIETAIDELKALELITSLDGFSYTTTPIVIKQLETILAKARGE